MKKAILPIIGAIALPVILMQLNPSMEIGGIILAVGIGLAIGFGISKAVFREKNTEESTQK